MGQILHGTCGNCGGLVTTPDVWMGINPPIPTCQSCGATVKNFGGPVRKMNPPIKGPDFLVDKLPKFDPWENMP